MRYLLDTCILVWLVSEPEKLSTACRGVIEQPTNQLYCSDVSCMEITFKWKSGKLQLPEEPRKWYEDQIGIWNIVPLELKRSHIYRSSELELFHRDPFDRLLIAQTICESMTLVTCDSAIKKYGVKVVW